MHTLSAQPLTRIPPSFFFVSLTYNTFPLWRSADEKDQSKIRFFFLVYLRRFRFHRHHGDLIKFPDWLVIVPWRQNGEKTLFDWVISTCTTLDLTLFTMPLPTFHPPPNLSISLFFPPFIFLFLWLLHLNITRSFSRIVTVTFFSYFSFHPLTVFTLFFFFLLCRCSFSPPSYPFSKKLS